jgi:hypothetical protein
MLDDWEGNEMALVMAPMVRSKFPKLQMIWLDVEVETGPVIENVAVVCKFTLQNLTSKPLSGTVAYLGELGSDDPSKGRMKVTNLQPGASLVGQVVGRAPRAQANAKLTLSYTDDNAPVVQEFKQPSAYGYVYIDVAAVYMLQLDWFKCIRTRDRVGYSDQVVVSCTALFSETGGSLPVPPDLAQDPVFMHPSNSTQIRKVSNVGGDGKQTPVNIRFGPFNSVPGKSSAINYAYGLVNSHDSDQLAVFRQIANYMSDGGEIVASLAAPTGAPAFALINYVVQEINQAVCANCDGLIAGDSFSIRSDELESNTFASGAYGKEMFYDGEKLGMQTPAACGRAPYYSVYSSFVRMSHFWSF